MSFAASSIFSTTFVGVGTYSMSGTVFVDAGAELAAAAAESEAAGAAEAVVGLVPVFAFALATPAEALTVGAAEFDVPELAGAPVPVDVPDGVQAAATASSDRPNE